MIASSVLSKCRPRFQAGCLVMTPAVEKLVEGGTLELPEYLCRHLACDWGEVSASDRRANDVALTGGGPLLSSYHIAPDVNLRFVTDAARLRTTAFLPHETLTSH
jgi:hypothetical protein